MGGEEFIMNNIYHFLLKVSKYDGRKFMIYKSLRGLGVGEDNICEYLNDGWKIRARFINGDMFQKWKIEDKNVIDSIENVLGIELESDFLFVETQEFFDELYRPNGIKMEVELWKDDESKPRIISLVDMNKEHRRNKIDKILDIMFIRHLEQYKDDILKFYQQKE